MKNIFNFKLYLEGIKKIKLVGIIVGIVTIVINALVPLVSLMNVQRSEYNSTPNLIDASEFSIPLILILFLTPFFFLSMFSFLNKRNESDFYHAIPYKRSCVLGSFVAAIYTWILAIIVTATLSAALLWWVNPTTTFPFSIIPLTIGVYTATAIYIGGFILLAMTLSGTATSNITVAIIAMFSFRVLGALITISLDELVPMYDIAYSIGKVFSFRYWLPTAVISSFYDSSVFSNAFLWIYSALVTVGVYAFAYVSYCKRKSESAGRSAPARKLQHVYRILFTLPFALFTTMSLILDGGDDFFVVLLAITLLVYYLYELVTVKNIKSALRATPMLLIVLVCCILFSVGCIGVAKNVYANEYDKDDMSSIRLYKYASILDFMDSGWNQYENIVTNKVMIPDEKAREIVSNALSYTIDYEQGYTDYDFDIPMTIQHVEIELNSGKKIGRRIRFTQEQYGELMRVIQASAEYKTAFITLPDASSIERINVSYCDWLSDKDMKRLWDSFTKEYNALSDDEKLKYKQQNVNSDQYYDEYYDSGIHFEYYDEDALKIHLNVYGTMDSSEYYANYTIPDRFTETRKIYFELIKRQQESVINQLTDFCNSDDDNISIDGLGKLYWMDIYTELYIDGSYYNHVCNWYADDVYADNMIKDSKEVYSLLLPYLTNASNNNRYCVISFNAEGNLSHHGYTQAIFGLKEMTKDEKNALLQAIGGIGVIEDPDSVVKEMNGFAEGMYDSCFEDYQYMNYSLGFTFDGEYYDLNNQFLQENWKDAVGIAKEAVSLMVPYLTYESSDENAIEVYISYSNEKYGTMTEYQSVFGWQCDDPDVVVKIGELLSQLKKATTF